MKKQIKTTIVIDEKIQQLITELINNGVNVSHLCRKAIKEAHSALPKKESTNAV